MNTITAQRARELFTYDSETGCLCWAVDKGQRARVGKQLKPSPKDEYIRVRVDGILMKAHRIAWTIAQGDIPDGLSVDHINGDRFDNRLCNLRLVNHKTNMQNRTRARKNSATGVMGIRQLPSGRFEARLGIGRTLKYLGSFDTAEDAHNAYLIAKRLNHPGCTI